MSIFSSPFDASLDTPNQLEAEGNQIRLVFEKTGPTTAKITWNIPTPMQGCSPDGVGVYNGIVITLDTAHEVITNRPVNHQVYLSDPTADFDLHAGDRLGTSLVIGAFYDDRTTVSLNITGIKANTPYYINGYAVDKQYRYHFKGAHAYSLDLAGPSTPDLPSTQLIQLGTDSGVPIIFTQFGNIQQQLSKQGVLGTDGTGLIPGQIYTFNVGLGLTPEGNKQQKFTIQIDGTDAQTYDDLIKALNKQFALLENPPQTPLMPNTGAYFWDATNQKLFQWDGDSHVELDVLIEPEDPADVLLGDYWHNTLTDELFRFNLPAPSGWNLTPYIKSQQDPTNLNCNAHWFNGMDTFVWNGSTWCELNTFIQITDPCALTNFPCGTYWFDTDDEKLFVWDTEVRKWNSTVAIFWPDDPNNLPTNTFWFDDTNNKLFRRTPPTWTEEVVIISVTDPAPLAAPLSYWFNPTAEELKQRNLTNTAWIDLTVLVWPEDPTDRDSCDLWWETDTNKLFSWDIINNEWDEVVSFIQSTTDPSICPPLTLNDVWFNPDTGILSRWDGLKWNVVSFINFLTDPTIVVINSVWFDSVNNKWFSWDGVMWVEFNPIDSPTDPTMIPNGTYWFDIDDNILYQRAGLIWVVLPYVTMPLTPKKGTVWFDSTNMLLMEWDTSPTSIGTKWIPKKTIITASLTNGGHLLLTTRAIGSSACVQILVGSIDPTTGAIITTDTLFTSPTGLSALLCPTIVGSDGLSPFPSYLEIGVGDDGTPDEHKALVQQVRLQLGYPVVEVELTDEQIGQGIDNAIQTLRERCSSAYKRVFFFLDVHPGVQSYLLTNKLAGYNKITNIMELLRLTSAFLSSAHGAGIYGQVILQHLYNMGTFDLLSYDLIGQYVNQLEISFAARLTFTFDQTERKLTIFNRFAFRERILVDAMIERTEQELLTDRYFIYWIQRFSIAEAKDTLAQIRGKYSTLPGAGGGVSLNAAELAADATTEMEKLLMELDDFVVDRPEDVGMGSTLVFG